MVATRVRTNGGVSGTLTTHTVIAPNVAPGAARASTAKGRGFGAPNVWATGTATLACDDAGDGKRN